MIKRLELILKTQNLSPSLLADKLNIQRSGISHLLSGRNKPSLDFILKILNAFPEINSDWLLFGKGNMYKNQEQMLKVDLPPMKEENTSSIFESPQDLFQNQNSMENQRNLFEEFQTTEKESNEGARIKPVEAEKIHEDISSKQGLGQNSQQAIDPQMRPYINQTPHSFEAGEVSQQPKYIKEHTRAGVWEQNKEKEIEKIIVFYSNGSFKEYLPS